ncbi:hypothetical protein [Candidatus Ichthyocystis sparus]|uniref:hypothetical protein n=1 Tax=Candidatus Ichthyocystis sparus TaxID=1561004 RepID=UPI00159EDA62|nr:hypothetical protein [Candidatus Ichthyocystis sparus]
MIIEVVSVSYNAKISHGIIVVVCTIFLILSYGWKFSILMVLFDDHNKWVHVSFG